MKNKKSQIGLLLSPLVIIVLAVLIFVIIGVLIFATKPLLMLAGAAILIISVLALARGVKVPTITWIIGIVLVVLPFVMTGLQSLTIASILD